MDGGKEEYVRITRGEYKGCIGKIAYEYEYFKGFYLVKIIYDPKKANPNKKIVVTKNNISKISFDEIHRYKLYNYGFSEIG